MNVTQERISNIHERIASIKKEEVTLPADVALGYIPRRPSLLLVGQTDPDRKAILEVLAGEMRLNHNYIELIGVLTDHINELYQHIDRCATTLGQVKKVNLDE